MDEQKKAIEQNKLAWNTKAYQTWLELYGHPSDVAEKLKQAPGHKPRRFLHHLASLKGKRIANPLGSNGRLAVSLALLGADVTVFDLSEESKHYALELAHCSAVDISYILTDFMAFDLEPFEASFDLLIMELGVLHYFLDLNALVERLAFLLKASGKLIVNDFHPLMTKAIHLKDKQLSLKGSYFKTEADEVEIAYQMAFEEPLPSCLVRYWTLAEIVTAFSKPPLRLECLEEFPYGDFHELPGLFTIVSTKL